jgi:hypothetical protein
MTTESKALSPNASSNDYDSKLPRRTMFGVALGIFGWRKRRQCVPVAAPMKCYRATCEDLGFVGGDPKKVYANVVGTADTVILNKKNMMGQWVPVCNDMDEDTSLAGFTHSCEHDWLPNTDYQLIAQWMVPAFSEQCEYCENSTTGPFDCVPEP